MDNRAAARRILHPQSAVERGDPVREAAQAGACRIRAASPVVLDLDDQLPVVAFDSHLGPFGAGVTADIGESLGDDEVGGRLDGFRKTALDRGVELDR